MKQYLLFIVLFMAMFTMSLFAQNAPVDFETGGYGADWTWTVFENDTNPAVEIIPNPDPSGGNTSSTVAQFTALQTGQPWAGTETLHGADIGTFDLDETNCTIKIMVWKPVISDVGIKLVKPDGWALPEIKVANTVTNQWEELTFNFFTQIENGYDQIVVFPDFDLAGRTQDNVCYFDNITFHPQTQIEGPEAPAPTPTADAANVISLFSNAYDNVTVDTWSAEWDVADVTDVQIDGNDTKLYSNLSYAGIEFTSSTIDASGMTHFHLDFWTADDTALPAVFKIKLVDFGADGVWGTDDVEHELIFDASSDPALVSNEWVGFDLALSEFTGLVTTEHIAQLIISGDPNTVYIDNIYFHNNATDSDEDEIAVRPYRLEQNYPNPFNPTTTIQYSLTKPGYAKVNLKGRIVETVVEGTREANTYQAVWNAENIPSGIYFYTLSVDGKNVETKQMILLK